jgi:serine/threonine protein kinase
MAELYTFRPLFPGTSQSDQIYKVCSVMGTPTSEIWENGIKLASQAQIVFPRFTKTPLSSLIPNASAEGIALIEAMLAYEPSKRPTCAQALTYPFFKSFSMPTEGCGPQCQSGPTKGGTFGSPKNFGSVGRKAPGGNNNNNNSMANNYNANTNGSNSNYNSIKSTHSSIKNSNSSNNSGGYKSYGGGGGNSGANGGAGGYKEYGGGGGGGGGGYKEYGGAGNGTKSQPDIRSQSRNSLAGGIDGGNMGGYKEYSSTAQKSYVSGGGAGGSFSRNMSKKKKTFDIDDDDVLSSPHSGSKNSIPSFGSQGASGFGGSYGYMPPAAAARAQGGAKRTMQLGGLLGHSASSKSPINKYAQRSNMFKASGARNMNGF